MADFSYVGNPDFRGFLAANAPQHLAYTGNDGGINNMDLTNYLGSQGVDIGNDMFYDFANDRKAQVADLYSQFQSLSAPSGNYAGGGTSDADAAAKADEQAYWGDQISALQRLLGSTATQKDQGLARIEDTYQSNVGRTQEKEAQGLQGYATNREDTTKGKLSAFGDISTKARTGYEALQRVLGLGNASVSSAARIVAPTAVSREATQQRTRANETFGRNLRDIDTKEGDFKVQVANALADLLNQKKSTTEDFLRSILGQELSLNEQLGQATTQREIAGGGSYRSANAARAPYQSRVGQIQGTLDSLFNDYRAPRFTPQDVNAQAPELSQYLVDPMKVAAGRANPNIDESLLPYLASIRQKDQNILG